MASFVIIMLTIAVIFMGCKSSDISDAEIDQLLKKLNKPAVKSIKSPDGDIVDCVDIYKQPAFDHPLLKNHTIKMRPSFYREGWNKVSSNTQKKSKSVTQLWTINGRCPKNTVSIRRTRREDILRAKSIERFGKKDPYTNVQPIGNATHAYAIVRAQGGGFRGCKANINIWAPYLQEQEEFSLAQMWLSSASGTTHGTTLEVGWQTFPEKYGDNRPRFFMYWTTDGYRNTGCYNLECPGFVHMAGSFAPGMALNATSVYEDDQEEIIISVRKDTASRDWWLVVDDSPIGYWPEALLPLIAEGVQEVIWGGEIMDYKIGGHHTSTHMGSGQFAQAGFTKAAYFRNLEVNDERNIRRQPRLLPFVTNVNCYNLLPNRNRFWGSHFFYGGPGRNPHCL